MSERIDTNQKLSPLGAGLKLAGFGIKAAEWVKDSVVKGVQEAGRDIDGSANLRYGGAVLLESADSVALLPPPDPSLPSGVADLAWYRQRNRLQYEDNFSRGESSSPVPTA